MADDPKIELAKLPLSDDSKNVRPLTTLEEDKHSQSQRKINFIWEVTQSLIAVCIIGGALAIVVWIVINDPMNRIMAFLFISNIVSNVIGFYFGRTNHQRVGGVQSGR